jgi:hypothetical protein
VSGSYFQVLWLQPALGRLIGRGLMEPGFKGFDDRRSYWAYLFARLKPGTSIESARAALNTQYKAIINDVEAPLQKGMSDQTMTRFRAKRMLIAPGRAGRAASIAKRARR